MYFKGDIHRFLPNPLQYCNIPLKPAPVAESCISNPIARFARFAIN